MGSWAFFAIDEIGDLALSFLDSHPVAVARLTRFLVVHGVPFVLHGAFTVDDDDQIVFESDTGAGSTDRGSGSRRPCGEVGERGRFF